MEPRAEPVCSDPPPEPARVRPALPLLPYQREDVESPARLRWNCWSRQTGKSFTKSLRRVLRGLLRRRNQVFLSAGERQSRELMLKARQHCQALKVAADLVDTRHFAGLHVRRMEIRLPGGVRIIGLPANPETARGFTGDVLLDEFAMHADDREIWGAMFPTLLRGDGELDVASTPRGCGNIFAELRDNPAFSHSTVTLPDAIAAGLPADEAAIRTALGDEQLYRQEFLCEFLDEAHALLPWQAIAACADASLRPAESVAALADDPRELFAGVDIGRLRDLTVVWVLARDRASTGPLVTVAIFELAAAPFRQQQALIHALLAIPRLRRCAMDAAGLGMQLVEEAQSRFGSHRVEAVTPTPAMRTQLAGGLRVAVEGRRIVIPQDERIFRDWHSVERTVSSGGHLRLAVPRREGSHADRFWAAALAVYAADAAAGGVIEMNRGATAAFSREGAW